MDMTSNNSVASIIVCAVLKVSICCSMEKQKARGPIMV